MTKSHSTGFIFIFYDFDISILKKCLWYALAKTNHIISSKQKCLYQKKRKNIQNGVFLVVWSEFVLGQKNIFSNWFILLIIVFVWCFYLQIMSVNRFVLLEFPPKDGTITKEFEVCDVSNLCKSSIRKNPQDYVNQFTGVKWSDGNRYNAIIREVGMLN